MIQALILVDLQNDFLNHPNLTPAKTPLLATIHNLLTLCRRTEIPVIHIQTQIKPDGSDRMQHWKKNDIWRCVKNSQGAESPEGFEPLENESCFSKQYFSAFTNPAFAQELKKKEIDNLMIAGLYMHGCVRCTAIDAYQLGYEVTIVDDAVGSYDPVHAELSRVYLHDRVAAFVEYGKLLIEHDSIIFGCSQHRSHHPEIKVDEACQSAADAYQNWSITSIEQRMELLERWHDELERKSDKLVSQLVKEIAKPLRNAKEEVDLGLSLLRSTIDHIHSPHGLVSESDETKVDVRNCPLGVVGLITPWNNPMAIAVGKLAPAIACGNTIVWKPAPESIQISEFILKILHDSGVLKGLVNLCLGGASTARRMILNSHIQAISFTGGVETGNRVSALCTYLCKPLQAELGGNNAVIIMEDFDVEKHARDLAMSAFSFSGQRCTSVQRFIVVEEIYDKFIEIIINEIGNLKIADPADPETDMGPLISTLHRDSVLARIREAADNGANVLCGGVIPDMLVEGAWLTPTLIDHVPIESVIAQKEIFGPVAVIFRVTDLESAIATNNAVDYGLIASLCSENESYRRQFMSTAHAGILNMNSNLLKIHPRAPFGGWKHSRIGPPEHGEWDFEFFTRPQAVYH